MAEDDRGDEGSKRRTGKHENGAGDTDGAGRTEGVEGVEKVEGRQHAPSQIPLLVDIAHERKPARVHKRRAKKENLSLDLNPEPPTTLDLFAEPGADHLAQAHEHERTPAPATGKSTADQEAPAPDPAPDPADPAIEAEMKARFREQAGELVDNLVQQYSQEILQRLREELGALLADLESDQKTSAPRRPGKDDPTD